MSNAFSKKRRITILLSIAFVFCAIAGGRYILEKQRMPEPLSTNFAETSVPVEPRAINYNPKQEPMNTLLTQIRKAATSRNIPGLHDLPSSISAVKLDNKAKTRKERMKLYAALIAEIETLCANEPKRKVCDPSAKLFGLPGGPRYSGIAPEGIKAPAIRAKYEANIAANTIAQKEWTDYLHLQSEMEHALWMAVIGAAGLYGDSEEEMHALKEAAADFPDPQAFIVEVSKNRLK